jgi:hypothetical protein
MSERSTAPVEVEVKLHVETAEGSTWRGALCVSATDEKGAKQVWIPKSQIKDMPEDREPGETITITIPEWLAIEAGLV